MQFRKQLTHLLTMPGFIVVVAFLVRMAFLFHQFHRFEEPSIRDHMQFGAETGAIAASIASGRGFSSPLTLAPSGYSAWLSPIYPYLLAGVFKLFGVYSYTSNLVIHCIDCAFSAFTCWPIAALGTRTFGKKVGGTAAWLWVILPSSIFYPVIWVWDTSLAGLWMALLVAATFALRGSSRKSAWVGYGALWAAGAMINPSLLSVLPVLALWALWPLRQDFRRAAVLATLTSMIFLAGLAPWTIRNYMVFHKFIPLRSNFGLELWLGNNPDVPDTWTPSLHPSDNRQEAAKFVAMTEIPYMEQKQSEAIAFMRAHPTDTARFFFHRFANNWISTSDPPGDLWAGFSLYYKLILVSNCLFALLSFLGVLFAYRTRNEWSLPFASILLFFPVLFYITHTDPRYRYPIDPIMTVLNVYAVAYLLSRLARRSPALQLQAEPLTRGGDLI
jgi:4-amino-4-deoxy-L-arabinose transferase-like glycosyltransferase